MSNDPDAKWLRERMEESRQRRIASAIPFERVWRAALVQRDSPEAKPAWLDWRIATASIACILLALGAAEHTVSERRQSREKEREFATVDGVLMTYWQAPSDDLLSAGNGTDLPNRDE